MIEFRKYFSMNNLILMIFEDLYSKNVFISRHKIDEQVSPLYTLTINAFNFVYVNIFIYIIYIYFFLDFVGFNERTLSWILARAINARFIRTVVASVAVFHPNNLFIIIIIIIIFRNIIIP